MSDYPFFHDATPNSFEKARLLRRNVTSAERELWKHIRRKQLDGLRFRRQHPVDQFILDFYCHESRLAIEVDGLIHEQHEQKMYDLERQIIIEGFGIKILRFKNEEVFSSLTEVLSKIKLEASTRLQLLKDSVATPSRPFPSLIAIGREGVVGLNNKTYSPQPLKSSPSRWLSGGEDLGGVTPNPSKEPKPKFPSEKDSVATPSRPSPHGEGENEFSKKTYSPQSLKSSPSGEDLGGVKPHLNKEPNPNSPSEKDSVATPSRPSPHGEGENEFSKKTYSPQPLKSSPSRWLSGGEDLGGVKPNLNKDPKPNE